MVRNGYYKKNIGIMLLVNRIRKGMGKVWVRWQRDCAQKTQKTGNVQF